MSPRNGAIMNTKQAESTFAATMRAAPVPDWVVKMQEHFRQTGTYRPEDLRRLLGDRRRTVQVGPNASFATFVKSK